MDEKAALRESARAARRALPAAERARWSEAIAEHALALPELAGARTIACYASHGSEVETTMLLRGLLARGLVVAVPVERGPRLGFVRLQHPWGWEPGPRGIPVPKQPWTEVEPASLDVLFVPGVLFGRDGSRLGQGGGHFDRFLGEHGKAVRVGLAFSAQLVDRIPTEAHDEAMDLVVTESGPLRMGRA